MEQPPARPGRFEVCGVPIEVHGLGSAAQAVVVQALRGRPARIHLCNADVLSRGVHDDAYRDLLRASTSNLPDGTPVVWTARRVGLEAAERVPGAELFLETVRQGVEHGLKHYLYGSTPDVLEHLREGLLSSAPQAQVVAQDSPPFRELTVDEFDELCDRIRASDADIVWVGLGTPRQDLLMARLEAAGVPVTTVAVGAAFDFLGGAKQRAPGWMQAIGLEWLHRLLSEPGRLWRRYLVGNLTYLWHARRTAELIELGPGRPTGNGQSRPRDSRTRITRGLVIADATVIALASILAYWGRLNLDDSLGVFQNELPVAAAILPLWLTILYGFGCYRPQLQNQSSEAFRRFLGATSVAVLVLGFVSFLFQLDLSRLYVGLVFVLVLALGSAVRGAVRAHLRRARQQGRLTRRVLVVGTDVDALEVAAAMRRYPVAGYDVIGFASNAGRAGDQVKHADGLCLLGRVDDVEQIATDHDVELVVVSPISVEPGALQRITLALEDSDVDVAVAPSLFEVVTRRVTVESVANVPILHVDQIRLVGWKAALKRTLDLAVSVTLGVLSLPVVAVAALAIKLEDRGPVLFVQRRVGKDGRIFRLYKFRTMVPDAEERIDEVAELNEAGQHFFKIRQDPRVTRVGRFLRKWSVDEIPQFWNVVRGDMSMVGPRPPIPAEVARYEPWHRRRLRIKPGITGVWQVSGRSDVPFDEAVRLDLFYIENWSIGYDLYLLVKTVWAVLGRGGAY